MGLLKKFWVWLTTSVARGPRKAHPDLYPIDVDKIARELNLVAEAARLGEGGLPALNSKVLSGPEAAIVQRVEKARQDYVDWAVLRLNVLSQNLARTDITQDANRASQADKEFERKASALLSEQDSLIRSLGETAKRKKAELASFREQNKLFRDAHYPTATGTFVRILILLLLIVVEGMCNAKFFALGLDSGLVGGFVTAGILAAFNVVVAFFFGKFPIRYINHVSFGWKTAGGFSVAASLLTMSTVGLGIAHYRDALIAEAIDPGKAALDSMLAHPFSLHDMFSWTLLGISIAFGIAALIDGLTSDDLYPRYGSLTRRTIEAIDDYEDELAGLRRELEELKDEELQSLDKIANQSQVSLAKFADTINDKKMAGSRLANAIQDADHSLNALLSKFRTENQLHRKGLPPPEYFDRPPELQPIQEFDFATNDDEAALLKQKELVARLLGEIEDIRARIQAAFNQQFDRLKPLDIHFPSEENQS